MPWCPRDLKGSSSLELTNLSLPADPGLLDSWIHPSRLTLLVLLRIFLESPAASLQHTCAARPVGQLNKQFALTLIKTTKHLFTSYPCAGPPCHPAALPRPVSVLQLQGACSRRSSLGGRERLTAVAVFLCHSGARHHFKLPLDSIHRMSKRR